MEALWRSRRNEEEQILESQAFLHICMTITPIQTLRNFSSYTHFLCIRLVHPSCASAYHTTLPLTRPFTTAWVGPQQPLGHYALPLSNQPIGTQQSSDAFTFARDISSPALPSPLLRSRSTVPIPYASRLTAACPFPSLQPQPQHQHQRRLQLPRRGSSTRP